MMWTSHLNHFPPCQESFPVGQGESGEVLCKECMSKIWDNHFALCLREEFRIMPPHPFMVFGRNCCAWIQAKAHQYGSPRELTYHVLQNLHVRPSQMRLCRSQSYHVSHSLGSLQSLCAPSHNEGLSLTHTRPSTTSILLVLSLKSIAIQFRQSRDHFQHYRQSERKPSTQTVSGGSQALRAYSSQAIRSVYPAEKKCLRN